MSMSRLALSASFVLLLSVSLHAQNCDCDQSGNPIPRARAGFGLPTFGLGCGTSNQQGCNAGCNQNCVSANELWSGFAANADCRGCVRCNKLRPNLPGFGGQPLSIYGCQNNETSCSDGCRLGLPTFSASWPRPLQFPGVACRSLQPQLQDVFNVFGACKKKNVRCDIQNDCYGKLGESKQQSAPQPIPASNQAPTPVIEAENNIPPAPIVEPLEESTTAAPSFDNASRLDYGQKTWSR